MHFFLKFSEFIAGMWWLSEEYQPSVLLLSPVVLLDHSKSPCFFQPWTLLYPARSFMHKCSRPTCIKLCISSADSNSLDAPQVWRCINKGFPGGSVGEESACNTGDTGRPKSDRCLGRAWQLTAVFLPGESPKRGACWAKVHGVTRSQTRLSTLDGKAPSPALKF